MSKTTVTIQINHDDKGNVTFTENGSTASQLEISKDQNLAIQLGTGFSGKGAQITAMELFTDVSHGKGTSVGSWQRTSPASQPSAELDITPDGNNILVDDTNTTGSDDWFFFAVTATDGTNTYSSDPELRVRKTGNG
jgi:polyribonucleotide nucleotidyltransferase